MEEKLTAEDIWKLVNPTTAAKKQALNSALNEVGTDLDELADYLQNKSDAIPQVQKTLAREIQLLKSRSERAEILEELADLEHRQWMHWSKYVAENHDIPEELREKWEENWKPYSELSEEMKEKDRKWARKALEIMNQKDSDVY